VAEVYYFGCWDSSGHFLVDRDGHSVLTAGPFDIYNLDGTFPNHVVSRHSGRRAEDETIASLAHWQGWTVLAMWDRSVDSRPGSNAAFVAPGELTHAQMWALAWEHFPQIVARLKAEPKEVSRG
jgi:hypothetical protein